MGTTAPAERCGSIKAALLLASRAPSVGSNISRANLAPLAVEVGERFRERLMSDSLTADELSEILFSLRIGHVELEGLEDALLDVASRPFAEESRPEIVELLLASDSTAGVEGAVQLVAEQLEASRTGSTLQPTGVGMAMVRAVRRERIPEAAAVLKQADGLLFPDEELIIEAGGRLSSVTSERRRLMRMAIEALARIETREAAGYMANMLESSRPAIRDAALRASLKAFTENPTGLLAQQMTEWAVNELETSPALDTASSPVALTAIGLSGREGVPRLQALSARVQEPSLHEAWLNGFLLAHRVARDEETLEAVRGLAVDGAFDASPDSYEALLRTLCEFGEPADFAWMRGLLSGAEPLQAVALLSAMESPDLWTGHGAQLEELALKAASDWAEQSFGGIVKELCVQRLATALDASDYEAALGRLMKATGDRRFTKAHQAASERAADRRRFATLQDRLQALSDEQRWEPLLAYLRTAGRLAQGERDALAGLVALAGIPPDAIRDALRDTDIALSERSWLLERLYASRHPHKADLLRDFVPALITEARAAPYELARLWEVAALFAAYGGELGREAAMRALERRARGADEEEERSWRERQQLIEELIKLECS